MYKPKDQTMIRVLVLYPRKEGDRFDFEYYKDIHMKLVKEKLNPYKIEVDQGLPVNDNPSPYHVVSHLTFNSIEELSEKYYKHAEELDIDKEKFTDIEIITQISEILKI